MHRELFLFELEFKIHVYIYKQKTNIKRNCDYLIQLNDNKTTIAFEHSCVLPQWCTVGKCEYKKK